MLIPESKASQPVQWGVEQEPQEKVYESQNRIRKPSIEDKIKSEEEFNSEDSYDSRDDAVVIKQ